MTDTLKLADGWLDRNIAAAEAARFSAKDAIALIESRMAEEITLRAGDVETHGPTLSAMADAIDRALAEARRKAGLDCAGKSPHTLGDHGRAEGTDCGDA